MKTSQLYDSFLPYRDALHLSRWVRGLTQIKTHLHNKAPIPERLGYWCGHSARALHPNLKPPNYSEEEFQTLLSQEEKRKTMTEEEKKEELEELSAEIQKKIESGELDLWEDTAKILLDPHECEQFLTESLQWISTKISPACNPTASTFEGIIKETVEFLNSTNFNPQEGKGFQRILYLWEEGKIRYEGEPPYKIVFSDQVAETLGIDAELESIKLQKLRPLNLKEKKKIHSAAKTAAKSLPHHKKTIESLEKTL
jgi:hypothetical protein